MSTNPDKNATPRLARLYYYTEQVGIAAQDSRLFVQMAILPGDAVQNKAAFDVLFAQLGLASEEIFVDYADGIFEVPAPERNRVEALLKAMPPLEALSGRPPHILRPGVDEYGLDNNMPPVAPHTGSPTRAERAKFTGLPVTFADQPNKSDGHKATSYTQREKPLSQNGYSAEFNDGVASKAGKKHR